MTATYAAPQTPKANALRGAAVALCLEGNTQAPTPPFPFETVHPGSLYTTGQWCWDAAWMAFCGASLGLGKRVEGWLQNWTSIQVSSGTNAGQIPVDVPYGGPAEVRISQMPVGAFAVYSVYQQTGDSAWLSTMYPVLKAWYAWWEATHEDTSGLCAWGHTAPTGNEANDRAISKLESGQDQVGPYQDGLFIQFSETYKGMTHVTPDLNGALVNEAKYLALIAGALGNSADAATYSSKATARAALMNAILWDDDQGCYQITLRDELSVAVGTANAANVGATSVALASALTVPLDRGSKLVFANGVTAQCSSHVAPGATTVPLIVPLSAAVPASTAVKARPFAYCKTLANVTWPMWAGVPSQAQARRLHDEHLMKVYDGTEADVCVFSPGSGRYGNYQCRFKHVQWQPSLQGSFAYLADGVSVPAGSGAAFLEMYYRGFDLAYLLPYDAPKECIHPAAPLNLAGAYAQTADATLAVSATDANGNPIAGCSATGGTGSSAATLVASGVGTTAIGSYNEDAGGQVPGTVTFSATAGSHALAAGPFYIETRPRGFVYLSPHGLLAQPRLHRYSIATQETGTVNNAVNSTGNTPADPSDYWNGDHWVNLEWVAVQGLLNYGMGRSAREVASRVVDRVYSEYERTGTLWERYSTRGVGHGSQNYGWSALAALLAQQFNF